MDDDEFDSVVLWGPDGSARIVVPEEDLPHGVKVDRSKVTGWPDVEAEGDVNTMIALRVPPKVGGRYGRDAEELVDLEPLQDRHITVVHLGRQPAQERDRLHGCLREWMAESEWPPMEGEAQGWGTFTPTEDSKQNVLWMGWNIPGLAEMRHDLVNRLHDDGFEWEDNYDFVPHETVGYTKEPLGSLPGYPDQPVRHSFGGLTVGEGNEDWTEYPFQSGLVMASGRPAVVAALEAAVDDELAAMTDSQLEALIAAGGADRNRGNAEKLRRYWTVGKGGAKIRWNTKGDFERCTKHLSKHLGPRAKGYCFSGDTEFLTRDGVMTFADAVGTRQFVLTQRAPTGKRSSHTVREDGYWVEAPIVSFGEQRLLTVILRRGKVKKVIRATPEHGWFAAPNNRNVRRFDVERLTTADLRPGMTLTSLIAAAPPVDIIPSPDGIRAGFVFGDGHRQSIGTTRVDVWGAKQDDVLRYFDGYPMREIKVAVSGLLGTRVNALPADFKELPATTNLSYLMGWLAGYIAADGDASASGSLGLSSKNQEHLEFARHAATLLGIATGPVTHYMRKGYGADDTALYRFCFMSRTVPFGLVLRKSHREHLFDGRDHPQLPVRWVVESVEDRGEVEEVFCAVVPETETFALTDTLWTSNCALRHKEMTGMYTGDMKHRILWGWGGKPGSYWARVAAKGGSAIAASGEGAPQIAGPDGSPVAMLIAGPQQRRRFVIPMLLPEGIESGDGRTFEPGVVQIRDFPIPLLWQPNSMQGHDGAMIVGRIDGAERVEGGIGNAYGVFDTSPIALEAVRMIEDGFLRGVSADLDKFEAKIIGKGGGTATAGEDSKDKDEKDDKDDVVAPDKMSINQGRVMAATLVAKPAFESVRIKLVDDDESEDAVEEVLVPAGGAVAADAGLPDGVYRGRIEGALRADAARFAQREVRRIKFSTEMAQFSNRSGLTASATPVAPTAPPIEWFDNPRLGKPTHLTITDDGRVFGHIAAWNVDHIGMGFGTKPPKSKSNYAYFRTGLLRTEEGVDVRVGQITLSGGHASLSADAQQAVKHYDDTQSAFADVVAGEDRHGIWIAGALRPEVTEGQLRAARASSPSGDWRPINGKLELVAVCQVNVPGFPVVEAMVAGGHVLALVAAGTAPLIADLVSAALPEAEVIDPDEFADAGVPDDQAEEDAETPSEEEAERGADEQEEKGEEPPEFSVRKPSVREMAASLAAERLEAQALSVRERMAGMLADTLVAGGTLGAEPEPKGLTIRDAAVLLFAMREEQAKEAMTAAARHALPDGTWRIADEDGLKTAVEEFGSCVPEDRDRVKRHIVRRAMSLGADGLLPVWWRDDAAVLSAAEPGGDAVPLV